MKITQENWGSNINCYLWGEVEFESDINLIMVEFHSLLSTTTSLLPPSVSPSLPPTLLINLLMSLSSPLRNVGSIYTASDPSEAKMQSQSPLFFPKGCRCKGKERVKEGERRQIRRGKCSSEGERSMMAGGLKQVNLAQQWLTPVNPPQWQQISPMAINCTQW